MKKLSLVLMLVFAGIVAVSAQQITGNVTDENGEPLIGATILIEGTTIGTVTDIDGKYTISAPAGSQALLFSYTGYATATVPIEGKSIIDVSLQSDVTQLSEVVVVGYGTVKRSDLTTSVSVVDGDKLTQQPVGSIDNLLQGASTGLQVVAQNGRPGGQAYIRIRGVGSVNASNEPLFIIDGVQVTQTDYNTLNPNDIQEISILKDAGATSIYGSRASNGVIIITTKKGTGKKAPSIAYSFQYGQKERTDDGFEMMNPTQKLDYEVALGQRSAESADAIRNNLSFLETNWEDVLLRTGEVRSHNLSISGGGAASNYFFSFSSYDEQGIAVGSDFGRITGRLNMDFQVADWLKVGNTLSLSKTDEDELRDRFNVQNPFYAIYAYNPYETEFQLDDKGEMILDENGEPQYNLTHEGFSISEAQRNNPEEAVRTNAIGSFYAEATIIPGLRAKTQIGANYQIFRRQYYIFPGSVLDGYVGDPDAPGIKTDEGADRYILNWTNTLAYDFSLNNAHNFGLLAGTEVYKNRFDGYRIDGKGFPSSEFFTQNNAAEITGGNTNRTEWALWSQFAEARYDFLSRYYATASVRRDGSSRFGSENKYGVFYAGSLGWNIAEEAFMAGNRIFDQLKFRVSAGTSGNEPNELYWQGTYAFGKYQDLTASLPNQLSNETIKWEENFNYSIGLDFGVLNNRISGSLDYYSRTTTDLLFPQPLSHTTGWTSRLANIGEMTNSGVELELVGDIVRTNDFTFSIFGSISTNKNEIQSLNNDGEDIINAASGVTLLREGLPVNTYYLVRYAGVDPATGDALYLDANDNVTNTYSGDYAVALEDKAPQPKYFGSFGTAFKGKGLDLGVNFYYAGGHYVYNYMIALNQSDGANVPDNQDVGALNYWKNPGDTGVLPRPDRTNNVNDSDRYLQKADYIRLRNVTLGYSLPATLMDRIFVKSLRVYVQGTNLWTLAPHFTGDPEVGRGSEESNLLLPGEFTLFSYPQTKGLTFGVDITF